MAYIGPAPNPGQNREVDDISSGFNGSEVNFTLQVNSQNVSPGSANAIIVSLGGVVQNPGTDYTIAASTITFTTAPANGLSFFGLVLGQQVDIQSVADSASIVTPTLSAPTVTGDLSIADKIIHTGDTNTAIRFPAADTITAETGGSERVRIMSDGRVGVGTSPDSGIQLHVQKSGEANMILEGDVNGQGGFFMMKNNSDNANTTMSIQNLDAGGQGTSEITFQNISNANNDGFIKFSTRPSGGSMTERMRLFSDGGMAIGTTTAAGMLNAAGTSYFGADANVKIYALSSSTEGRIGTGGISSVSNVPFTFYVADGGQNFEAMRILTDGRVVIKAADFNASIGSSNKGISIGDTNTGTLFAAGGTTTQNHIMFINPNGTVGRIQTNGSNTTFLTSSDYRLKENAVSISDGITRLKTLKPYRFNFKADAETTLDGFFAHEVQTAVPQAVDGTKDELFTEENKFGEYEVGDPKYQSIDHSTLVPLITAALQEAITKIETLETKVAALEAA